MHGLEHAELTFFLEGSIVIPLYFVLRPKYCISSMCQAVITKVMRGCNNALVSSFPPCAQKVFARPL